VDRPHDAERPIVVRVNPVNFSKRALAYAFATLLVPVPAVPAAQTSAVAATPAMLYQEATADSIAERFTKLTEDKANRVTDEGAEVRIDVPAENATYSFTRAGHPAHPSLIRRAAGQRNGSVFIQTSGITAADRSAFEKWFAIVLRQDDEIRGRLRTK
jgi:hypothetical protein